MTVEWEKRSRDGRTHGSTFDIIESETRRRVAAMVSESDADRIISDHAQAARVTQLEKALQDLLDKLEETTAAAAGIYFFAHAHGIKYGGPTYEAEEQVARAILNQSPIARGEDHD